MSDDGGSSSPRVPPPPPLLETLGSPSSSPSSPSSPSNLILVRDSDDEEGPFFEFDDSDTASDDDAFHPPTDSFAATSIPPLGRTLIFLFMLAPYLKLGALLLPHARIYPRFGIPVIIFFAVLSAFARQIWYMLARYVGKADVETVVLDTFARGRRRETSRRRLRIAVRLSTCLSRVLLAIVYLRESVNMVLPFLPERVLLPARLGVTAVAALVVVPLSLATSIGDRRIVAATWASVLFYVIWLALAGYGHNVGKFEDYVSLEGRGILFDQFSIIAFAFTTLWDIPLYASLKASTRTVQISGRRSKSYRAVSIVATAIAVGLVFPAMWFTPSTAPSDTGNTTTTIVTTATAQWTLQPPSVDSYNITSAIASLAALTLILFIPTLIITSPPLPLPARLRRLGGLTLSRIVLLALIFGGTFLPSRASTVLSDLCIIISLIGTYFIPALLHIITHTFKRQLSIIVPRPTSSAGGRDEEERQPLAAHDELLQRKERELQRRRKWRRVVWDVGVWVLLLPVGGGGIIWAAGRMARLW